MRPIDYFDTAADAKAEGTAIIDGTTQLTFADLRCFTESIAAALTTLADPAEPAPVAIMSRNDYRALACVLGVMRAGHAIVPVHVKNSAADVEAYLAATRPVCAFYHSSHMDLVRAVRQDSRLPSIRWVCLDAEVGDDPSLAAFANGKTIVADWGCVREDSERPVYIRQTSGTTGAPKLVIDDIASFNASNRVLRHMLVRGDDPPVFLAAAPLSHACGVYSLSVLSLGGTVVILPDFDAAQVLRSVQQHHITHLWMSPTGLYLLLDAQETIHADCSSLKCMVLGAAAVSPDKLREATAAFGPCVCLNYSQIESGFLTWLDSKTIAAGAAGDHPERLGSSGQSLFVGRIAFMGANGALLPHGEIGEIVVRGASVKNYRNPQDSTEARSHGWHHTGDLGYLDRDGYLYVVGRTKDVIISGGFKVSASDVERAIMELREVRECAVVAVPDALRGETVAAVIAVRSGQTLQSDTVIRHCQGRLGAAKSPRAIHQWAELPKTAVGKIDKLKIRACLVELVESGPTSTAR